MGVQYSLYKDIDIDDFDAVVVGSGFAGSVVARELAERGNMKVLIIESVSILPVICMTNTTKPGF